MTKTETRNLQRRIWKLRISRQTKTRDYRETMALLKMGQILEERILRDVMKTGNEYAQMIRDMAQLRETFLTKELRKI